MDFVTLSKKTGGRLKTIPSLWNSQKAVMELSLECYPLWEQSEWLDFYFAYLCEKHLPGIIPINEKVCGTTFFDGIKDFIPDFIGGIKEKTNKEKSKQKESNFSSEDFDIAYTNYQHWRQIEWVDSYFSFLCEKKLAGILQIPGPSYDKMHFNAFLEIPWIFKSYIENTGNKKIILEDADLITQGLAEYEKIGIIVGSGFIEYPAKNSVANGKNDKNCKEKLTLMKELRQHTIFNLNHIYFLPFTSDLIKKCETFQPGVAKRENMREKIIFDTDIIKDICKYTISFSEK